MTSLADIRGQTTLAAARNNLMATSRYGGQARWIVITAVAAFALAPATAQVPKVENDLLQKVLDAMSPQMTAHALSATYVRTAYDPQTLQAYAQHDAAKVKRTTISELVVGSQGVRESVCDARSVRKGAKRWAFHYANNGKRLQVYDSKNKRGSVRPNPRTDRNHLSLVAAPYTRTSRGRFISRALPVLMARFDGARVTSQTTGTSEGIETVTLEGEYEDSDPERYFVIIIFPERNHAVAGFKEYDQNKRILTDMHAADFAEVSGQLWLPRTTSLAKYRYDDYEGDTVQRFRQEILDPKTVAVEAGSFSLTFPSDAKIRESARGIDIGKLRRETQDAALGTLDGILAYEIPSDRKGDAIVARTEQAYEREFDKEQDPHAPRKALEMPESDAMRAGFIILLVPLVAAGGAIALFVRHKKARPGNVDRGKVQERR